MRFWAVVNLSADRRPKQEASILKFSDKIKPLIMADSFPLSREPVEAFWKLKAVIESTFLQVG